MEGVASVTNAGQRGGEVEDGFQVLILEIDMGDTPEGEFVLRWNSKA